NAPPDGGLARPHGADKIDVGATRHKHQCPLRARKRRRQAAWFGLSRVKRHMLTENSPLYHVQVHRQMRWCGPGSLAAVSRRKASAFWIHLERVPLPSVFPAEFRG